MSFAHLLMPRLLFIVCDMVMHIQVWQCSALAQHTFEWTLVLQYCCGVLWCCCKLSNAQLTSPHEDVRLGHCYKMAVNTDMNFDAVLNA